MVFSALFPEKHVVPRAWPTHHCYLLNIKTMNKSVYPHATTQNTEDQLQYVNRIYL